MKKTEAERLNTIKCSMCKKTSKIYHLYRLKILCERCFNQTQNKKEEAHLNVKTRNRQKIR